MFLFSLSVHEIKIEGYKVDGKILEDVRLSSSKLGPDRTMGSQEQLQKSYKKNYKITQQNYKTTTQNYNNYKQLQQTIKSYKKSKRQKQLQINYDKLQQIQQNTKQSCRKL